MTTAVLERPPRTLEEVAEAIRNAGGDQATIDALVAEERRLERAAAGRLAASRKYDALRLEWYENIAYPEFLQAQAYCSGGKMLSLLGEQKTDEPSVLWTGSESDAQAWASEELKTWWLDHPRTTFRAWLLQRARATRVHREDIEGEAMTSTEQDTPPADPQAEVRARLAARGITPRSTAPRAAGAPVMPPPRPATLAAFAGGAEVAVPGPARMVTATAANVVPAAYAQPAASVIDGATLWHLVRRYLSYYVAFRTQADLDIVTGWIFHAVARDRDDTGLGPLIWRASARLIVTSKTRGSGKSTLLDLIVILTQAAGKIPKITPARIAQVNGKYHECVVLDEAKTIFGKGAKSLELQGILLAGYTRRTNYEISGKRLSVFGPAAIAGKDEFIKDADGTQIEDLVSRAFTVRLWPPATPKPEVDERAEEDGEALAGLLVEWTNAYRGSLKQAVRDLAAEDQEIAEEAQRAAEAAGRKAPPVDLRRGQISRSLRACALVAGPAVYADMCAALDGSARSEAVATLAALQERAKSWGDGIVDDDTPGVLVADPAGDDTDAEWDED